MSTRTPGVRVLPDHLGIHEHIPLLAAGEYRKITDGNGDTYFHACTPNGHLCNLQRHTVIEHDDGTITVSPSIRVSGPDKTQPRGPDDRYPDIELWHGYLEGGVWRAC